MIALSCASHKREGTLRHEVSEILSDLCTEFREIIARACREFCLMLSTERDGVVNSVELTYPVHYAIWAVQFIYGGNFANLFPDFRVHLLLPHQRARPFRDPRCQRQDQIE